MLQIKFKKLEENTVLPQKAHVNDAALDLTVTSVKKKGLFKVQYGFGFATDLPKGCYAKIYSRSSVHKNFMWLCNSVGIIDANYRGEWQAVFYKIPFISKPYKVGDRACQFNLEEDVNFQMKQVSNLLDSSRGSGAFGSTGN